MEYLHTYPDFVGLEKTFNDAGYNIEVDLSNTLIIEKLGNEGEWIEYDDISNELKQALDKFTIDNNIEY